MKPRRLRLPNVSEFDRLFIPRDEDETGIRGSTLPDRRDDYMRYQDLWAGRALAEAPADRKTAEQAVSKIYRWLGVPEPQTFMWVKSPRAFTDVIITFIRVRFGSLRAWNMVQSVRQHIKNPIPYWEDDLVDEYIAASDVLVKDSIRNASSQQQIHVHSQPPALRSAVWNGIGEHIMRYIYTRMQEDLANLTRNYKVPYPELSHTDGCMAGQFNAPHAALMFELRMKGVKFSEEDEQLIDAWGELVKSACIWRPYRGFALMCERPTTISLDDGVRLNNLKGPALEWPDGFATYAIAGVPVESKYILHPENITVDVIESQANMEIRRSLTTIYGEERYLKESGAEVVSLGRNGSRLWARRNPRDAEIFQMVEVKNSTPEPDGSIKTYFIRVPPTVNSADAAVAWTFGMSENEYNPEKET